MSLLKTVTRVSMNSHPASELIRLHIVFTGSFARTGFRKLVEGIFITGLMGHAARLEFTTWPHGAFYLGKL